MSQNDESNPPVEALNQRIVAGTDGAAFYIYHPQDLQHRLSSPLPWPSFHFACRPEFEAGTLVAFDTGSDGGYAFRITDGPLTEREKTWLAGSWDFRYVVRHGRTYLDGGYALPSDVYFDDSGEWPHQWITLPNGKYKVTVSAIEWYSEPGAFDDDGEITEQALTNYVIQFRPVESLDAIKVSKTPPRLETSRDWPAVESPSFAEYDTFNEDIIELEDRYVVLVDEKQAPIPGYQMELKISDKFHDAVFGSRSNTMLPNRIKRLVIASSSDVPCIGVLAQPSGASKSDNGPWTMSFHAKQLLMVTSLEPTKPWMSGFVKALDRPASKVSDERLNNLKHAFAKYATANTEYHKNIEHPDFEVEYVLSMQMVTGVTHVLIHHIQMPVASRIELLALSDAERVERLLEIMA